MEADYNFTGIGYGDESADFDGSQSLYQMPLGEDPTSMEGMNQASAADRAIREECRGCASAQGGTDFDNRLAEMEAQCPQQTEAADLVSGPYYDEIPGTDCWEQQRTWHESDNTGDPPEPDWETNAPKVDRVVTRKP